MLQPREASILKRFLSAGGLAAAFLAFAGATAGLSAGPTVDSCPVFPDNNVWNVPVDNAPVHPRSDAWVSNMDPDAGLKADFGSGLYEGKPIGLPWLFVPKDQPKVPIYWQAYGEEQAAPDESDAGPYPIPPDAPIEGGPHGTDDRHVIVIQEQSCTLYELYKAVPNEDGSWNAVSGAKFDLEANELRPDKWTSADAAGLPIFPGLVRWDEVAAGEITHALRFTAPRTAPAHVWPARHNASTSDQPGLPPMGARFRLRADVDISGFSPTNQVILRALQTYGLILADNGSPWFLTGAPNDAWNNDELRELLQIKGSDFEAVDISGWMHDPDSAEAVLP